MAGAQDLQENRIRRIKKSARGGRGGLGRAGARLLHVLDVVFERPILTIRQLEAALGVPYRTAQRYVERLEEIGILREVTGRARNRLYRADEILRVIEGP